MNPPPLYTGGRGDNTPYTLVRREEEGRKVWVRGGGRVVGLWAEKVRGAREIPLKSLGPAHFRRTYLTWPTEKPFEFQLLSHL